MILRSSPQSRSKGKADRRSLRQLANRLRRDWSRRTNRFPVVQDGWCYSRLLQADDPPQGWKLHVSATPLSAAAVLDRSEPILRRADALFKVPATLELLEALNAGLPEFSQIGKFLTVYPRCDAEAVVLARQLHCATRGLAGPRVPYDAVYRPSSLVHYRYGSFHAGNGDGVLIDPAGKRHRDKRSAGGAVPAWIPNPFGAARTASRQAEGPFGYDFVPFKVITRRGKGAVYEAIDFSASPARLVIIKEGRQHGEVSVAGEDGVDRIRNEARVLRSLQRAGVPVPRIVREFHLRGDRYLVLQKVVGRPLLPRTGTPARCASASRAAQWLDAIQPLLARIHRAGWVWRDCKPSHILVRRRSISLVDFEGACRLDETELLPWGSPGYTPPSYGKNSFRRRAGTREDDYALGVIAFQLLAAEFPPPSAGGRAAIYRRSACPASLRARIERLLQL